MLKIKNFSLKSRGDIVLEIDYLHVPKGTKIQICGENNSGKSLLSKSLVTEYNDFDGEIKIREQNSILLKNRRKTILIEKNEQLISNMSIWENIILPQKKITSRLKTKILNFCQLCGLEDIIEEPVSKISSSDQKIVEIIRAVVQLPFLIILDDFDIFFDEIKIIKIMSLFDYALSSGTSIITTSKIRCNEFDICYQIQNKKMVQL